MLSSINKPNGGVDSHFLHMHQQQQQQQQKAQFSNMYSTNMIMPAVASVTGWTLRVKVSGFEHLEKTLVVTGDMHVGRVIFQLVEQLDSIRQDWSDFALWWPDKKQWLNRTKMTLDQYGVQADAVLLFTRIHKQIRLVMPDQQVVELSVDFSVNLFNTVKKVCKYIGIRHAEELSMLTCPSYNAAPVTSPDDKSKSQSKENSANAASMGRRLGANPYSTMPSSRSGQQLVRATAVAADASTDSASTSTTSTLNNSSSNSNSLLGGVKFKRERSNSVSLTDDYSGSDGSSARRHVLHLSPIIPTQEFLNKFEFKYRHLFDKTRVNARWLDSSKSLMEQGIRENDFVQLRFKYYAFFDLNLKHDQVRVNQIYEQAKWAILNDELDCTDQELITFAALQLHIQLLTKSAYYALMTSPSGSDRNSATQTRPDSLASSSYSHMRDSRGGGKQDSIILSPPAELGNGGSVPIEDEDDVDTALSKLERTLDMMQVGGETTSTPIQDERPLSVKSSHEIKQARQESLSSKPSDSARANGGGQDQALAEQLLLMRSQRVLTFRKLKSYYFVLTSAGQLSYYKSAAEVRSSKPVERLSLRGCEVVSDVNLANRKYGICLKVTTATDGPTELNLRCPNEDVYARWMSACKLAAKSKPVDVREPSYTNEVHSILSLLRIQQQQLHAGSASPQQPPAVESPAKPGEPHLINSSSLSSFKSATSKSTNGGSGGLRSGLVKYTDNFEVQPTNLLPARLFKKLKPKQLNDRIMEVYTASISDLDLFDAKLRYIKSWQALPDYGVSYFAARVRGSRFKEEIIGVSSQHIARKSPDGELIKSWPLISMKSWNVNWEVKQFEMSFDDEELVFTCLNCEAKILHEFIGGYIFLSLRSSASAAAATNGSRTDDGCGGVDDDMFFKLTDKR